FFFRQSEQIRPRGVKNLSARFFRHLVHLRVLALVDIDVSKQLTLQQKKPALVIGRLEATEELNQAHLLPGELPLVQDQGLVTTPEELHQCLPQGLDVQPAGVGYPEVENGSLGGDVLLEPEPVR